MASTLIRLSFQRKGGLLLKQSHSLAKNGVSRTLGKTPFSTATSSHYTVPLMACLTPYIATTTYCLEGKVSLGGVHDHGEEIKKVYERALVRAREKELHQSKSQFRKFTAYLHRTLRMWMRALKLMACLSPVLVLYPVQRFLTPQPQHKDVDAHDLALAFDDEHKVEGALGWYLRLCLQCVEYSGAAVIKLMQWAGSRPDMFGHDFCAVFSKLQDDTTPHSWRHTEKVLREAYGDDWHKRIKINQKDLLGSGCIGQVYKGEVLDAEGKPMKVAVKVLHPSVESNIDADLDLLRWFVRTVQSLPWDIFSNLKWINLEGGIDEFDDMLKLQLDCRVEAANLERFNQNFADSEHVVFPKVIEGYEPTKDVLIETFCEGIPVIKFAKQHRHNQELLSEMCYVAIETVCKMIFLDNFMHGKSKT
jgi:aarF domain-containing kinase